MAKGITDKKDKRQKGQKAKGVSDFLADWRIMKRKVKKVPKLDKSK